MSRSKSDIEHLMNEVTEHENSRLRALRQRYERSVDAPIESERRSASLGLSQHDLEHYSLARAIDCVRGAASRSGKCDGIERECSNELTKRFDAPLSAFAVPMDVMEYRGPRPNFLVGASAPTDLSFIDMLRNRSIAFQLGARRLGDLRDDVAIPRQISNTSVTWLSTGASVNASDLSFGQLSATPRTAIIITEVSEQLLRQSSADQIIKSGFAADLAVGVDSAVINGAGGAQPLGILNTPISSASGTSLAYAGLVGAQKTVADANAIVNAAALGFATTPTIAETLKNRQRFTSTDSPLWRGAFHDGEIEGVRAVSSKQVPASTLLYGDWSTVVIGEWGPLMLSADKGGTRFNQALVGIRAMWMLDVLVTSPSSFVKISNIT